MCRFSGALLVASVIGSPVLGLAIRAETGSETMVPSVSQVVQPLVQFTSVELHNGTKAVLQYGTVHRVTLLKGSTDFSRIRVSQQRLVIDKCPDKCPRGYELQVEIVTPVILALSVANGGRIESQGDFPRQAALSLAVSNGGVLDARAILASNITAAVAHGGRILAKPQAKLIASVNQGGMITYWGTAQVTSAIEHGGVVNKGADADVNKHLFDFGASTDSVPPVPLLPAIPPIRNQ